MKDHDHRIILLRLEDPTTVEPVNETKKKLTEMLAFVEEKRETWKMNEGDYLKLSNLMKEAFDSV